MLLLLLMLPLLNVEFPIGHYNQDQRKGDASPNVSAINVSHY
jgi:hypothetical protein